VLPAAYDRAGYDLEINHGVEPLPPLESEWQAWAQRLVREQGFRRD
jgi:hypothetical protein